MKAICPRTEYHQAALGGRGHGSWEAGGPSVQADGDNRADLLPVEKIRRTEDGPSQASQGPGEGEFSVEEAGGGLVAVQPDPEGSFFGQLLSPAKRRQEVMWLRERWDLGASPNAWHMEYWDSPDLRNTEPVMSPKRNQIRRSRW